MTNEEAIRILKYERPSEEYVGSLKEAIDMAIEALSAEVDNDNLIIKGAKGIQDGLYNIKDGKLYKYYAKGGIVQAYEIVQSPEAEQVAGKLNNLDDSLLTGDSDACKESKSKLDTISRQDALKPFCIAPDGTRIPEVDCDNFPVEFSVEFIKKHLLSLPSAPDSRQRGEWIWKDRHIKRTRQVKGITADGEETVVSVHEDYIEQRPYCSECGKWNDSDHLSYCPNCGADMRGGEEDGKKKYL